MHKASRNWRRSAALALMAAVAVCSPAWAAEGSPTATELLKDAATEVSYLSFDRALPLFQQAGKLAAPGSPQAEQALFGQAVCLQQITPAAADRIGEASAVYRKLAEKPGPLAAQSMMALGRIAELVDYLGDAPDRPAARQWYEKAREASGDSGELADEATLRIAATYIQEMDSDSVKKGISILTDWLAKHPKNPLASAMWQYAANTYLYPLNDYGQALECYMKADALGLMEKGREGPVYWRMANLADRLGRNDIAITYYTKIIEKTPTSGKAYESQLALKRLGAPVPQIKLFRAGDKAAPASPASPTPATGPADARASTIQSQQPAGKGVEKP